MIYSGNRIKHLNHNIVHIYISHLLFLASVLFRVFAIYRDNGCYVIGSWFYENDKQIFTEFIRKTVSKVHTVKMNATNGPKDDQNDMKELQRNTARERMRERWVQIRNDRTT